MARQENGTTGRQLADLEPIWQYTAQAPGGPLEIYYARQILRYSPAIRQMTSAGTL